MSVLIKDGKLQTASVCDNKYDNPGDPVAKKSDADLKSDLAFHEKTLKENKKQLAAEKKAGAAPQRIQWLQEMITWDTGIIKLYKGEIAKRKKKS